MFSILSFCFFYWTLTWNWNKTLSCTKIALSTGQDTLKRNELQSIGISGFWFETTGACLWFLKGNWLRNCKALNQSQLSTYFRFLNYLVLRMVDSHLSIVWMLWGVCINVIPYRPLHMCDFVIKFWLKSSLHISELNSIRDLMLRVL